ncbi:flavodoxin [Olsenella sp. kh2p3]|jgi:flavodoxin|uniref:flavodoxin n=1 Tax=Olsenella sp. kh2p3 TaxID=1797112 RepID=UPI000916C8F3|nr:flavodoxin [Olsenella sp. kh2p3]SFX37501.1 Flavodoxin [Olsenella sp. kh2p3]
MRQIDRRSFLALAGASLTAFALAGCSSQSPSTGSSNASSQQTSTETDASITPAGKSIVVYFSATGNTKSIAEKIAATTGSDIYEITPAEPYTTADLNYNDQNSRTTQEMNDPSARPALGGDGIDLSPYTTVYLGYPIWWGDAPRIMSTFVESIDLSSATVVPFVTSSSSPIGSSAKNLQSLANGGTWKDGGRIDVSASDDDIKDFVEKNR